MLKPSLEELFSQKFVTQSIQQNDAINQQENELDEITLRHAENKKTGIYNYFMNIHKEQLVVYFIGLLILYSFIDNINFSTKNVISLFFALFAIYVLNERNEKLYVGDMERIQMKLKSIYPQPRYFYKDSGIIELVYSIKAFRDLSEKIFDELVLELDTFLELETLVYTEDVSKLNRLYTMLKDKRKIILNTMHSFIFVIESADNTYMNKYSKALKSLQYIMNIHINNIRTYINEKIKGQGIRANTKYIEDDTEEISYEPDEEKFDFYS